MGIGLETTEKYIQQALEEFDTNPLASEFMQKILNAEPDLFYKVAIKHLSSDGQSNAHRFLATILVRRHDLLDRLTSPGFATREGAVTLFKRFYEVDPSFDIKLAQKLPECGYTDQVGAFDSPRSARALDVLDQTSQGTRLLRILSPLTGSEDPRIAAKAALFIGRRLQNPARLVGDGTTLARPTGTRDSRASRRNGELFLLISTAIAIRSIRKWNGGR